MKVLLILLDGMRPDAMMNCNNSYVEELLKKSAYSLNARTVFPSVTLPCHFSLFFSVNPERHGILTNTYVPQVRPIDGLFEQLKKFKKTSAMYYTWGELRDLAKPQSITQIVHRAGGVYGYEAAQLKLLDDAKKYLKEDAPDFLFYYNGLPDETGHDTHWLSDEYMRTLDIGFDWVRELMEAAGEEYVTIILADHGGHDRSHGTTMEEDMTIPLIITGKGIENRKLENACITDVAPTIAKIIGIEPDSDWEGHSLV